MASAAVRRFVRREIARLDQLELPAPAPAPAPAPPEPPAVELEALGVQLDARCDRGLTAAARRQVARAAWDLGARPRK